MRPDSSNIIFQLAADFVNNTARHVFLTGKAGTGKTTFLKHIQNTTRKKCIVVAPTGVAAINANGVTMHSFFQLPFTPYIPTSRIGDGIITNKHALFKNIRFNRNKRQLLQEIELMIIDEISMVRADALDAIDIILREYRKQPSVAFGGVQVLYIGDMYQLPPVVSEQEWQMLSEHYASPFFFDSKAVQEVPPLYIELKKIYRQNDEQFIRILNSVRTNTVDSEHLQLLNSRVNADFIPPKEEKYIILTTHNSKADYTNASELEKLPGKLYSFEGELKGEFSESTLPADPTLHLKEGAQVMFIKNDKGDTRRYYNGKLAIVKKVNYERIVVVPIGSKEEVTLEKYTWRNIRYKLNESGGHLEEEELGTFKQYPIRLAWAVTIHKSQGLTFEKAIIDAGQAFAAGQVYVALSRCTSLDGIVLYSRIGVHNINTDFRVVEFAQKEASQEYLEPTLAKEKKAYELSQIIKMFDWKNIIESLRKWQGELPARKIDKQADVMLLTVEILRKALQQQEVASKFQKQLESIIAAIEEPDAVERLRDRMNKSIGHFTRAVHEELIIPLNKHIEEIKKAKHSRIKSYQEELSSLHTLLWDKIYDLWNATYNGATFTEGLQEYTRHEKKSPPPRIETIPEKLPAASTAVVAAVTVAAVEPEKPVKIKQAVGTTRVESLRQYQAGKTIDEIAKMRNLARGTIEGHLAESIGLGEIELTAVLDPERIAIIMPVVQKHGHVTLSPIREELGQDFTFTEIRMVAQHVKRMAELATSDSEQAV